jgi:hypothetical protein
MKQAVVVVGEDVFGSGRGSSGAQNQEIRDGAAS